MRAPISYTVGARVFSRSTETERSELAYIASRAARDADLQYESVAGQYTQLPSKLPERVRQAAADATLGIVEPYKMAEALETYLSSNFRYTLTPSSVPSGRDFVEYFLETGEGYCVYFASAMAVMARSLGIPSRMVCGYGVKPAGYHSWIATGTEAHAWVECYFKGLGWIEFDPTAGSSFLRQAGGGAVSPANHHVFFPGWDHHGRAGGHDDGDGHHPAGGHHDGIGRHDDGGGRPRFGGVGNADGTPRADLRHCRRCASSGAGRRLAGSRLRETVPAGHRPSKTAEAWRTGGILLRGLPAAAPSARLRSPGQRNHETVRRTDPYKTGWGRRVRGARHGTGGFPSHDGLAVWGAGAFSRRGGTAVRIA